MSQFSFSIPNEAGSSFRADVNSGLQALASQSSGATEPTTKYAYQRWADTTNGVIKRRNAANSAWVIDGPLAETYNVARSSNTILANADHGKWFRATAGFTQTFTAAATLGDGWWVGYRVESGATLVLDPNSTEQVDGGTTKSIVGPQSGIIVCDGTGFYTTGYYTVTAADPLGGIRKNGVINGCCRVQAGAAATLSTSPQYGKCDTWAGWASTGAVSAGTFTLDTAASIGTYASAMQFSGVTLTGSGVLSARQRIPAIDAKFWKNKTCSVFATVLHDVGSSVNFTVIVRKPNGSDNYSGVTAIHTGTAQAVSSGSGTQVSTGTSVAAASFAMGDCSNGIEIEIQAAVGAITTKNLRISDIMLVEVTGSETAAPEFPRESFLEVAQRAGYLYEKSYEYATDPATATRAGIVVMGPAGNSASGNGPGARFRYPKRASPTMRYWDGAGTSNKWSFRNGAAWTDGQTPLNAVQADSQSFVVETTSPAVLPVAIHFDADARL